MGKEGEILGRRNGHTTPTNLVPIYWMDDETASPRQS